MTLSEAILEAEAATAAIRENRGADKALAREALDAVISEVLMSALVDTLCEWPPAKVIALAKRMESGTP